MYKWLPIECAFVFCVVTLLPSPVEAQKKRMFSLCKKLRRVDNNQELLNLKSAFESCSNSENAPIIIYISKMIAIPLANIN